MRKLLSFILILALATAAVVAFAWQDFISPSKLEQETNIILPKGSGFSRSVDILTENKVIGHPLFFKVIAYARGDAGRIKAGEYNFPANASPKEILQMLVDGKVVVHKITIAEGLNVREVFELISEDKILAGELPANIAEGSLFPETYHYTYGDSRAALILRMQEKMKKTLDELWETRSDKLPFTTKEQALVLASIVEKETGVPAERSRVAAVFINRLRIGMKLQSDPTVVYGLEKLEGKAMGRSLTTNDLRTQSEYNTYVINALPPEPIANPSREAIEAVLHPMETNELYFVATGDGGHNFAATLEEHNKNVQEYRSKLRQ